MCLYQMLVIPDILLVLWPTVHLRVLFSEMAPETLFFVRALRVTTPVEGVFMVNGHAFLYKSVLTGLR
jgi:hypothetical protein